MRLIDRLNPRRRPTLFRRIIGTSMLLITLALLALGASQRYDNAREMYGQYGHNFVPQLSAIGEELRLEGVNRDLGDIPTQEQFSPGLNLFALCTNDSTAYFVSRALRKLGVAEPCSYLSQFETEWLTEPLELRPGQHFYLYPLEIEGPQNQHTLLILRDANEAKKALDEKNHWVTLKLAMLLPTIMLLLVSGAVWGMKPLRQLQAQLGEITGGDRQRLDEPQASELVGLTDALNELLAQSEHRNEIYQNAMKDLAHSLKTRLAATQAILGDNPDTPESLRTELYDQLGQMDQMVQYQLRKAVMGRQGLTQAQAEVEPVAQSLKQMLAKVYRDKEVDFSLELQPGLKFPGSADDLMEMLGNLLDNAHRFAIDKVVLTTRREQDTFVMTVDDDGPGIEPELRQSVIGRGVRADERHPGQGIGLAVCHELSRTYQGDLTITESPLGGARILVQLPLKKNLH
ncbi:ATP-binding protein [Ferrimonas marina]|uniref:histidine kinase n=1 Tax=Ferrimonas marina TaxID=299255 RepID=A0A1M5QYP6_9GAMM|nr:ATP-binding protein [Ferrimonas marina]SHH18663.1 two-component system, OmpR family, sensor histidine kinase PhoQ [Ferrimonas marina]